MRRRLARAAERLAEVEGGDPSLAEQEDLERHIRCAEFSATLAIYQAYLRNAAWSRTDWRGRPYDPRAEAVANLAGLGMSPEDQEVALTDPKRWEAYFHDYRRCGYVDGMPLG